MKNITAIDISPPILYLATFWFSSYWPTCCWPNQIAGFFKLYYLREEVNDEVNMFGIQRNIEVFCKLKEVFYKLVLSFWMCVASHAQVIFAYLCNVFRKIWGTKLIFCLQINTNVFYKVLVSPWMFITRLAQSTQNNKFAISLQYLKENGKNEVDFLPADKHQRFLKIDTIILGVCSQACVNYSKYKFAIFLQYFLKEVSDEVVFLHADKHERFAQFNTIIFDRDYQALPKFPRIASLQCLYINSKKKLEMKLVFCMKINIKVSYKLISTLWDWKLSTRWSYHYWWAWLCISKVLQVTSLQ